jgi:hypothetical protein
LFFSVLLILFGFKAFGQKNISGEYKTNVSAYGMFEKILVLNCDSTAVLNFRGDLMNDNSYGRWRINKKILTLIFDTVQSVNSRYKGLLCFAVRNKNLYELGMTKKLYNELKNRINQENSKKDERIVLPSFRKLNRQQNQILVNYKGAIKRQFFRITKSYKCK